jgi:hypothetical protein
VKRYWRPEWIFVIVIGGWSVVYFVHYYSDSNYLDGAMANLFATILGIVVGIPIALEINRRQQIDQDATALLVKQREEVNRKERVLTLIRSELESNRIDVLARGKPIDSGGVREVRTRTFKDELWSAFSDGGELQHVNNPEILALVSEAYYGIRTSRFLEHLYIKAVLYPGLRGSAEIHNQIIEYLTAFDPKIIVDIDKAIAKIDAEIDSSINE